MHTSLSNCLNLLYPDATASVSLQGVMLSYFKGNNVFTTRMIKCEDHDLMIDIFMVPRSFSGADNLPMPQPLSIHQSVSMITINELDPSEDMASAGVLTHKNFKVPFKRAPCKGEEVDLRDFRWIVDLNSEEFHDRQLSFRNCEGAGGMWGDPSPVISVDTGIVYTQGVSTELLYRRDEEGRLNPLGRIAYRAGIDIRSRLLQVTVQDQNGTSVFNWSKLDKFFYLIQISNTCHIKHDAKRPEDTAGKSDFDLFYDYVSDPVLSHRRFDLQACVGNFDTVNSVLDSYPDICIFGYLGGPYQ